MKDLTKQFLSDSDRDRVTAAVKAAESRTAGEIVVMIVSASYHYPMANVIGGVLFALPLASIFTVLVGQWLWIGSQNMWLFLGFLTVFYVIFHTLTKRTPALKRRLISPHEIDEEVKETAVAAFFNEGLYRTRDETGVLVLISVFEQKVWVLADRGIDTKVADGQWNQIVTMIIEGIKQTRQADAICDAVAKIGEILETHFPVKPDDTDELNNLIVRG